MDNASAAGKKRSGFPKYPTSDMYCFVLTLWLLTDTHTHSQQQNIQKLQEHLYKLVQGSAKQHCPCGNHPSHGVPNIGSQHRQLPSLSGYYLALDKAAWPFNLKATSTDIQQYTAFRTHQAAHCVELKFVWGTWSTQAIKEAVAEAHV